MSGTDWWYVDLAAVIAFVGIVAFGLFADVSGLARVVLAAPLVLFLPGYALVSVLYPDEKAGDRRPFDDPQSGLQGTPSEGRGIGAIERFVLSIVASIALVPTVALVSTVTPWGIALRPVLAGLGSVTILLALFGIVARARCPAAARFSPSIRVGSLLFSDRGRSAYDATNVTPFNVAIGLGLVLLLASTGFAIANQPEPETFTEFAVETENVTGDTETMYPSSYARGEPQELAVSIENREGRDASYTTVAVLQRVEYADGGVEVLESDELARESIAVPDGEGRSQTLEIAPTMAGDDLRLVLLLYEGDAPADPSTATAYRVVRLPIEVA